MPVSIPRREHSDNLPLWTTCRDSISGQPAIKAKTTTYLPASFAKTEPEVYEDFLKRAYWLDVTGRTHAALTGMVFRKEADKKIPPAMEPLLENIDGQGQSIDQLGKELVDNKSLQ